MSTLSRYLRILSPFISIWTIEGEANLRHAQIWFIENNNIHQNNTHTNNNNSSSVTFDDDLNIDRRGDVNVKTSTRALIIVRKSCAHVNLTLSSIVQRSGLSKTKSRQADIHYGAVSKDTRWISRRHKVDASGRVRTRVLLIPRRTRCHGATVTPY